MQELSLNVLDLAQNSIRAGASQISVAAAEHPTEHLLTITVSDNGVGMTPEQCRKILQKARSDSGGIGVKNVNDRLKIRFGERFGITLKSEQDVGTVVTVRIPKITDEEEQP